MGNKSSKQLIPSEAGPLGQTATDKIVNSILDAVQQRLLEEARSAIESGDALFTSIILSKDGLEILAVGRDRTKSKSPMATSELNAIEAFYSVTDKTRPLAVDCIFVSVYEPNAISLCNLAVAGFDNFVYIFTRESSMELETHQSSNDSLVEIFGVPGQVKYQPRNKYWSCFPLMELIENCPSNAGLLTRMEELKGKFEELVKGPVHEYEPVEATSSKSNK
eukprot:g8450.t1